MKTINTRILEMYDTSTKTTYWIIEKEGFLWWNVVSNSNGKFGQIPIKFATKEAAIVEATRIHGFNKVTSRIVWTSTHLD